MKLYFAGRPFATPECVRNAEVFTTALRAGHEMFLPQGQEPGKTARKVEASAMWLDFT